MQIYLVGGAVRDQLLGLTVSEKDWVVVGATVAEMLKLGYQPVGKDFPVFLHPDTHEEYALARTERKTGKGYKGFVFHADPHVTLKQDLARRDLTINAIAKSETGQLIDPYHGQTDLNNKIFRHVSSAFAEDPVRILRLARFACRFTDFTIAPSTLKLMKDMVNNGEVDALVAERVCQELLRALGYSQPACFFTVLAQCGALAILFPDINKNPLSVDNLAKFSEVNTDPCARFAALTHTLPRQSIKQMCQHLRLPSAYQDLASLVQRHHANYSTILQQEAKTILKFILQTDAIRRQQRFTTLITICQHFTTQSADEPQQTLLTLVDKIRTINTTSLQQQGLRGAEFAHALQELRITTINNHL